MRAIRLLHDFEIVDKKLLVKVDAKTKEKLDEYCKTKYPTAVEGKLDDAAKQEDEHIKVHLAGILKEHEIELSRDPDPNRGEYKINCTVIQYSHITVSISDRTRRNDKRTGEAPKPEVSY